MKSCKFVARKGFFFSTLMEWYKFQYLEYDLFVQNIFRVMFKVLFYHVLTFDFEILSLRLGYSLKKMSEDNSGFTEKWLRN